jgi:hypothetical protein
MRAIFCLKTVGQDEIVCWELALMSLGIHCAVISDEIQCYQRLYSDKSERKFMLVLDQLTAGILDKLDQIEAVTFEVLLLCTDPFKKLPENIRRSKFVNFYMGYTPDTFDPRDLLTAASKIQTKDIFGLEKYLRGGTVIHSQPVCTPREKESVLAAIGRGVGDLAELLSKASVEQYATRIEMVMDELILNAVFNANPRYHAAPRDQGFELQPYDQVLVRWGFDGMHFCFSVLDHFGTLLKDTVTKYVDGTLPNQDTLVRSSGGYGFRYIHEHSSQLIFNINRNAQTEVIVLMAFTRRIKDFTNRLKSLHFYHA